ncbi:response regulator [Thalassolituus sp. LLYu03]|uniref:response regulator n=1 Tax=Thalassolituus sp. LLYu03 TaxID=3421656 RepID=UPI003D276097
MAALNVLIVDDAAFIRDLVKKAVRETYPGCEIHEAIDGRKAISLMNSKSINLVLCDWEMPEVSGIEVLQWMRADERYKAIPFMMITSRGERDHVVKAVEAGVSDYIGKPFTRENFAGKLTKLVWRHLKIKPSQAEAPANPLAAGAVSVLGAEQTAGKPKGGDMGGASVLMGAATKLPPQVRAPADSGSAAALLGAAEAPKPQAKAGVRAKGIASVRFGSGGTAKLVIKDISLQELIGVFRREGKLPALLEQAVLDIVDQETGDVARINGYVRMMQAQEPHPDAETIQMIIRYVDDDPEKLETLSRYIARVR